MTQQEFTKRTNVEVTATEFDIINAMYMSCECDKDEFCKMWVKMNPNRVKNAKVEKLMAERKAAYEGCLWDWFKKRGGTKEYYANYNTPIAYVSLNTYQVRAMSFAGILLDGMTLSDVHY